MRRRSFLLSALTAAPCLGAAAQARISSKPTVEMRGKIVRVQTAMGQGMPFLEVKDDAGAVTKVWLGSMRYLVEHNFNPKAGESIEVKGYKMDGAVTAIRVTINGKTLQLRDSEGYPLWRRSHGSHPHR